MRIVLVRSPTDHLLALWQSTDLTANGNELGHLRTQKQTSSGYETYYRLESQMPVFERGDITHEPTVKVIEIT